MNSNNKLAEMPQATCRLCNERWRVPKYIADTINANNPFECPNCRKKFARRKPK